MTGRTLLLNGLRNYFGKMAFNSPPEFLLRNAIKRARPQIGLFGVRAQSTYKAALVQELGKPLEIQDVDKTDIGEGFVRMELHHAAVNFADILISQGKYQDKPPLPFCPGSELAGKVTEVGSGVTRLKVGDMVFGVNPLAGGFAEEAIVSEQMLQPMPYGMSSEVGSAILIVYGTAFMALTRKAKIQPGETVLVTSAAGGVGLAAVDLAANYFGAKVIGACGSDEKCEIAKSKGAFATINYSKQKVNERVKEITGGKGADIIVDNVGGDMFKECLRSVAFEGRILIIGFASGDIPKIPANILLVKSCSAIGIWWGNYSMRHPKAFKESLLGVMDAYAKGKIKPHISKVFPLGQVNEAFHYVYDRKSTGKVIINCQSMK